MEGSCENEMFLLISVRIEDQHTVDGIILGDSTHSLRS
jgi:hypothetical protein